MSDIKRIVVIGGGAAGMMAAIAASATDGAQVTVLERNEKLGKKIYITGKGRCNFTNADTGEEFLSNVVHNPKFLYSALCAFDSDAVAEFFESSGMPYKVERGGRLFPLSDKSSDVIKALASKMERQRVRVLLNTACTAIAVTDGIVRGVETAHGTIEADAVIVSTGGVSYPSTGSTGDGYVFAEKVGHKVVTPVGALVSIEVCEPIAMQGLSLKNVRFSIKKGKKELANAFGEMLFTDRGVSGPIVLTCSSYINREQVSKLTAHIDCKPALSHEALDERVRRDFQKYANKAFQNSLDDLLPKSLIPEMVRRSGIAPFKKVHQITAPERETLVSCMKDLTFRVKALDARERAIVTAGGVDVKQVSPTTMESRLIKGLYFAGEVLDLDALTGGYNLQIAFSTGYLAGKSAKESV